jgi:type I restriction enzyme S subunit
MTLLVAGRYNVNNHAHVLTGTTKCETKWLLYFYMHADVTPFLTRQGVGRFKLTKEALSNTPLLLPPLPEQRKIAEILTTWDEARTHLDALIEAQERRKKALMQQLLTGRCRLKGFTTKWKIFRFSDFLVESRIHGSDGSTANKLTVKLYGRGVVPKQERLAGSENTRYFRRNAGQFIYSKLDFLNGAFGIVPEHLDGYETTLDVPAFDVCDTADSKWLLYFVSREEFYSQQLGAAAGGRKARRVNPSEFLAMKFPAPILEEQRQIAAILDTADQELALLRNQRTLLDQQKRGLMQRLLTGKLRVKTTPVSHV